MRLTSKVLDRLILQVMNEMRLKEGKHIPFKSQYEAEKHKRAQQEEAESRRKKKQELRPDEDLMKLSKGILEEGELVAEPDEEGFVKVKKDALHRLLKEGKIDIEATCNKNSYYKINQILDLLNRLNLSEKGDLHKKK